MSHKADHQSHGLLCGLDKRAGTPGMKFKAVADADDFPGRDPLERLSYAAASGVAYASGTQAPDVALEQQKMEWCDVMLWVFPLWCAAPPLAAGPRWPADAAGLSVPGHSRMSPLPAVAACKAWAGVCLAAAWPPDGEAQGACHDRNS